MFSIPEDDFRRLVEDVVQGRSLAPGAVAELLGIPESSLRNAARHAYPLTRPDDAVQFAMRELVLAADAGPGAVQDSLAWRLVRQPV
ncbi:MAG: hypothetical protein HY854_12020 [Burkholderiales bacterium]|nr:hypothetical protein [Burkholderiales bacterium]